MQPARTVQRPADSGERMRRLVSLYSSTIGKKIVMAVTGVLLLGFVVAHMLGNLKVYQGPEKFNAYAEFLRDAGTPLLGHGQLLWLVRLVLLAAVVVHIVAAVQLGRLSLAARPVRYGRTPHEELTYASRTMRWGGAVIFLFVVYHLMHLTWGNAHPGFVRGDVYHNFVTGFGQWPVAVAYSFAMLALGLHIYHGVWSGFQTLGLDGPRARRIRRPLAAGLALVVVIGNLSFPLAVLTGAVR